MLTFLDTQHNQQLEYQKEGISIPGPDKLDKILEDLSLTKTAEICTHALHILNSEFSFDSEQTYDQWTHHCRPLHIPLTNYNVVLSNNSSDNKTYKSTLENVIESDSSSTAQNTQLSDGKSTSLRERFICKYCGKELSRKQNLTYHEKTHRDEKPFPCLICGKRFRVRNQLTRHGNTHSKEKKFKCLECGKWFRHRSNLYTHKGLHKEIIRVYKCPVCYKEFRAIANLSIHFFTHFDFSPYHCSCGKSFQTKCHLGRHLKRKVGSGHVDCT